MADYQKVTGLSSVEVACRQPFDFELSLRAMRSFGLPARGGEAGRRADVRGIPADSPEESLEAEPRLRLGVKMGGVPTLLEIRRARSTGAVVAAEARPAPGSPGQLHDMAARVVNAHLDLRPFYESAVDHPVLGPLTRSLRGLKAFRPASLFDMLVIAVIEQQISLVAAHHIQERLVARFGSLVEGESVFPDAEVLAEASLEELSACGLSRRKAEYVRGMAQQVVDGRLDLAALEAVPDDEVRERIVALRGFGAWSADYILIRGLARPDAVPADDLAVRTVVGTMLGRGERLPAEEVRALLAPVAPYRGLAAFYLLVAQRLL